MHMNLKNLLFCGTIFLSLTGCDFGVGLSALSVTKVVKNPRIYEGQEITVVGKLTEADEKLKIFNISYSLEGPSPDQSIYLQNMIAKVNPGVQVIVRGPFTAVTLPVLGSYLVVDAKSVEECTKISFC